MKIAHQFSPQRPAAQHCAELTKAGPRPEERAALMLAWRRDLARGLAEDLSALLSGDRLEVSVSEPETLVGAAAIARIGPVAANSLLRCGPSGESALLSLDFAVALALTERSFGGEGRVAADAPEQLPRSAALMVEEAAAATARAITRASHGDTPPPPGAPDRSGVIVRSESAARLKPFDPDEPCVMFTIVIGNADGCEWRASLALAAEKMDRLLPGAGKQGHSNAAAATGTRTAPRGPATGMTAPFGEMPLRLHVVLAEFDLSLGRLQALGPGDLIPISVGRQVPLMAGDTVIAHGSVGTADGSMAIRLTRSTPVFAESPPR